MILTSEQHLQRNFDKIGPLSNAQFLATKALSKKLLYAYNVDLKNIVAVDTFGREAIVDIVRAIADYKNENISALKIRATIRGMTGGTEQSGNLTLENILDIKFDESIGILVIENDKCVFTTIPCWTEISDLVTVIRDPYNWVNQDSLNELLPPNTSLSDFIAVRDSLERDIYHGIEFNSF